MFSNNSNISVVQCADDANIDPQEIDHRKSVVRECEHPDICAEHVLHCPN